jgi:putative transposase
MIKDVVLTRPADGKWFATFRLEMPTPTSPPHTGPAVGLDVGLYNLIALSDGTKIEAPRFYRKSEKRLAEAQRRYSLHPSCRRRRVLACLHAKVTRQRKDFLHKLSRFLVNTYSLIAVENLNVKGMAQGNKPGMSKSIHDAGWAMLFRMLDYKAASAGSQIRRVPALYTSQLCFGCWAYIPKHLDVRVHNCPSCGLTLDRDVNAARVILARALGWEPTVGLEPRSSMPLGIE